MDEIDGVTKVLPSETGEPSPDDDLFEQKDVKVEVMRSRGAGGQVRPVLSSSHQLSLITSSAR